jgi:hypothetical protein
MNLPIWLIVKAEEHALSITKENLGAVSLASLDENPDQTPKGQTT